MDFFKPTSSRNFIPPNAEQASRIKEKKDEMDILNKMSVGSFAPLQRQTQRSSEYWLRAKEINDLVQKAKEEVKEEVKEKEKCVGSPLWEALTIYQRAPFYSLEDPKYVNMNPVVKFPNSDDEVPNRAIEELLEVFFPEKAREAARTGVKNSFEDTCPFKPDVNLFLTSKEVKDNDLLRDSISLSFFDEPMICSNGKSFSKSTVDAYSGIGTQRDRDMFASAIPNEALRAFINTLRLNDEQKGSYGGKSKKMQKNRKRSQSRKRS